MYTVIIAFAKAQSRPLYVTYSKDPDKWQKEFIKKVDKGGTDFYDKFKEFGTLDFWRLPGTFTREMLAAQLAAVDAEYLKAYQSKNLGMPWEPQTAQQWEATIAKREARNATLATAARVKQVDSLKAAGAIPESEDVSVLRSQLDTLKHDLAKALSDIALLKAAIFPLKPTA